MNILFINNDGGGFADLILVLDGMTVSQFIATKLPGVSPANLTIRVNREVTTGDRVLRDGDRITATPTKIEGGMNILFINNDGGGFADRIMVLDGMTVSQFIATKLPGVSPANLTIRVNREVTTGDRVLRDGDRITATPTKIEGGLGL